MYYDSTVVVVPVYICYQWTIFNQSNVVFLKSCTIEIRTTTKAPLYSPNKGLTIFIKCASFKEWLQQCMMVQTKATKNKYNRYYITTNVDKIKIYMSGERLLPWVYPSNHSLFVCGFFNSQSKERRIRNPIQYYNYNIIAIILTCLAQYCGSSVSMSLCSRTRPEPMGVAIWDDQSWPANDEEFVPSNIVEISTSKQLSTEYSTGGGGGLEHKDTYLLAYMYNI